ncbi:MAG: DNA (cytosine-5-)-methyltransferase [Bacillota bacterium]
MKKTVCELFAGVGGFRLGLERSSDDWETVWMNQWEPSRKSQWAYECYIENFGKDKAINLYSNQDINKVSTEVIPDHNLLVGGFPCQDYSVARTQAQGIQGKKGVLWWDIERILREKETPFVLLENVNRLLKSPSTQRGRDFGIILSSLNNLGYSVEWRVINAADYGFPQKRRRVFIFATKNNNKYSDIYSKDNNKNILINKGFFASVFPVNQKKGYKIKNTSIKDDLVEMTNDFNFEFEDSGYMTDGIVNTLDTEPKKISDDKKTKIKDIMQENIPAKYFISNDELEDWEYLKGSKAEKRVAKNGHEYTFREGAIPFPDKIDAPARTILTSERTKSRSTHIIKDKETDKLRKLTPIECERLNGFPDNWTDTETMSHPFRYFAMGNALVVGLIEKMGEKLIKIFENE